MPSTDRIVGQSSGLDGLTAGSHVCCVIDSAAQFETLSAECLAEGARRGEKLFQFGPRHNLGRLAADESVTLADPLASFAPTGPADRAAMFAAFRQITAQARGEGYEGIRLFADMDWLLPSSPSRRDVASFELLLDEVVAELGATVVCAYRREHFEPATIAELVAVHPLCAGTVATELGFRVWNVTRDVWEVSGEIDLRNAEPFGRAMTAAADERSSLRLRVGDLRFIAVAGINALVQVALSRPELSFVIEDANLAFHRCWELLDLPRQLPRVALRPARAAGANTGAGADSPGADSPIADRPGLGLSTAAAVEGD